MPRRSIELSTAEQLSVPPVCAAVRHWRILRGLEQKELAARLGIHKNAVSNWERGRSRPDLNLLPALCRELGVSPCELLGIETEETGYSRRERQLVSQYRRLEERFQTHVDDMLTSLIRAQNAEERPALRAVEFHPIRLAAGSDAAIRDITESETLWLHDTPLLRRAVSIYKVNGDSMEPSFSDGDLVFVEEMSEAAPLRPGEIGAFAVGNETYIKEYQPDGLHSHNPAYGVLRFDEEAGVYAIGRVLGTVDPALLATDTEVRAYLEWNGAGE